MISYSGYDEIIKRIYEYNQEHVFEYWNELDDGGKRKLLDDLSGVNPELLKKLYEDRDEEKSMDYQPAPFITIPVTGEEIKKYSAAREAGIKYIKEGKVAAFIVAGGQGSRLGFDGPKGMVPVAPVSGKTLFQIHAEKIVKYSKKYGIAIPLLIMTSKTNHNETFEYFQKNNFFGLNKDIVIIFSQNMIPSLDPDGKLILKERDSLFKNPDGHGGSLTALLTSGALAEIKARGIEMISYFQVDNPLLNIIDPVFIGFHKNNNADISSKTMIKAYPDEKIGVFVEFTNNRIGLIEYSDLPADKVNLKDKNGKLVFSAGNPAIHLFSCEFIEKTISGIDNSLPYHAAKKRIKAFQGGKEVEIDGFKYEKFVFDALRLTDKNIILEILREEEFAPVKNASGVDSIESARGLMINLYRRWLEKRGISIPVKARAIEISPSAAVEADDIDSSIKLPDEEKIYLDENF